MKTKGIFIVFGLMFTSLLFVGCTVKDLGNGLNINAQIRPVGDNGTTGGAAGNVAGGQVGSENRRTNSTGSTEGNVEAGQSDGVEGETNATIAETNETAEASTVVEAAPAVNVIGTAQDDASQLTVNSFAYADKLGNGASGIEPDWDDKFIVLNVTVKNRQTAKVTTQPFAKMRIYTSLTDTQGSQCKAEAADVIQGAFLPNDLTPGEIRTGLVGCSVPIEAHNIKFKFDSATVQVFKYTDIADHLLVNGGIGQYVVNPNSALSIKVNNVQYVQHTKKDGYNYGGVSDTITGECSTDNAGSNSGWDCAVLIVNVTVKNEDNIPWTQTYSLKKLLTVVGSPGHEREREYSDKLFEVIDSPLNLQNMRYGEERTGQIVYLVGDGAPHTTIPIVLKRTDLFEFGTTEAKLQ